MRSAKHGLGIGLAGAIAVSILIVSSILRSTSSTAGLGFVFVPVYFVIAFVGFFIWGYSLGHTKTWLASVPRKFDFKIGLALLVGIGGTVFLLLGLGNGILLTSLVSQIQAMKADQELQHVFDHSYFKRNKFILGAIAQNPAAAAELLDRIAKLSDPSLHQAMGSLFRAGR